MKRIKFLAFFMILIFMVSLFVLNIEVTIRQGINYKVSTLKIPLYLKILDFYDRHYNYKWLAHKLTEGKTSDEEKVISIFRWTIENIAQQPTELKAVDDHVWHIIVRGYGTHDQFSDVFTTLCNYAGVKAFFMRLFNKEHTSQIPFSFVKINKNWCLFDPYNGIFFIKKDGALASIQDIAEGNWIAKSAGENFNRSKIKYADYFNAILSANFDESHKMSRANIQSPINRFIYEMKKAREITSNKN